ncbi:MAG: hypothetical protein RR555_09990 [Bacteroidales bacterium]
MKKRSKKLELKKEAITILDNLQASNILGGVEGESSLSWIQEMCCYTWGDQCTTTTGKCESAGAN